MFSYAKKYYNFGFAFNLHGDGTGHMRDVRHNTHTCVRSLLER